MRGKERQQGGKVCVVTALLCPRAKTLAPRGGGIFGTTDLRLKKSLHVDPAVQKAEQCRSVVAMERLELCLN